MSERLEIKKGMNETARSADCYKVDSSKSFFFPSLFSLFAQLHLTQADSIDVTVFFFFQEHAALLRFTL